LSKSKPHEKQITALYMQQKVAVLSVSDDGMFKITSMSTEFENKTIDPQEHELKCFALRDEQFNYNNLELFFGTGSGKLFYYSWGFIKVDKQIIFDDAKEGPITNVVCSNDIVAWSTLKKIRIIHFSKK